MIGTAEVQEELRDELRGGLDGRLPDLPAGVRALRAGDGGDQDGVPAPVRDPELLADLQEQGVAGHGVRGHAQLENRRRAGGEQGGRAHQPEHRREPVGGLHHGAGPGRQEPGQPAGPEVRPARRRRPLPRAVQQGHHGPGPRQGRPGRRRQSRHPPAQPGHHQQVQADGASARTAQAHHDLLPDPPRQGRPQQV